jgi:exopolysaccharide production protein ExoZ
MSNKKIDAIQALRGIAAVAVVADHIWGLSTAGDYAVNVFFVISGFTMVYASQKQFGAASSVYPFLLRRFIRIFPTYWLSLLIFISIFPAAASDIRHLALSIFLIAEPHQFPILPPAWTLTIEVYFYVIFSLSIFLHRQWAVIAVCLMLFLLSCLRSVTHIDIFIPYTNPIVLLFGAGVALANVYCNGGRVNKIGSSTLIAVSFLWVSALSLHGHDVGWRWRVLLLGPPAVMLFVGAVMTTPITLLSWKPLQELGDASYSIYITHWLFVSLLPTPFHFAPFVMALIFGMGFHYALERPFLRRAYQWLKPTLQVQPISHPDQSLIHSEPVARANRSAAAVMGQQIAPSVNATSRPR